MTGPARDENSRALVFRPVFPPFERPLKSSVARARADMDAVRVPSMHWKEEQPHTALERRTFRAERALAANDRLAQTGPYDVERPPRSSLLRPSSAQSTVTSVAEPTENFPNQQQRVKLAAYLSQTLQEMAGTGMLSDKANNVRARSLVIAEFRRMEEQALEEQKLFDLCPLLQCLDERRKGCKNPIENTEVK